MTMDTPANQRFAGKTVLITGGVTSYRRHRDVQIPLCSGSGSPA